MTGWASVGGFLTYGLGATACVVAAAIILRSGDRERSDRLAALVALSLSFAWCITAASFETTRALVQFTEVCRTLGWLYMVFRLFGNDGRDETLRLVRPVLLALCLVEVLQLLLLVLSIEAEPGVLEANSRTAFQVFAILRMMVAVGVLMLLHNLYVGAAPGSRVLLAWPTAAMAGIFAFDLNFYTLAYILGNWPTELSTLRGVATALAAIPFALGFNRRSAELEFRPSRAVAFRSLSLVAIATYLGVMIGLARWLDMLSGDMARLTQVGMVIAAGALCLIWLPSDRLRGWMRVTAVKHLFKHRYDYRNEWIRFTHTIGRTGFEEKGLQDRCIKALADVTESPAGLLLLPEEDGSLVLSERWQWPADEVPLKAMSADLALILEREGLIIDFDEIRSGVDYHGELALVPEWLRESRKAWAAVPLLHFDRLVGVVVLARPAYTRGLDWEDFDLLGVVGRQLASYLAEEAGQAALAEANRFDEFNRRMAFVLHDIKNLSSQMSLLLRNAEKHADKPEFRTDMLVTLRNSADKLNALLARLNRYGSGRKDNDRPFDLSDAVQTLVRRFENIHPVVVLQDEPARVVGDREGFEQALAHIIQNAVDASEPGSPISLETFRDGASGHLRVSDAGHGMSPQFLRTKLFKPFESSKDGGFGIGAFEAREMIRAMGGRVDVESREGVGTRFTLSLPLQAARRLSGIEHFATSESSQ